MCRRRDCLGLCLAAFGGGLVLSQLFGGVLCPLILGAACIVGGCICLKQV